MPLLQVAFPLVIGSVCGIIGTAGSGIPPGFPNASNTGVPSGTALTPFSGNLFSSADGQTISAQDVTGGGIIIQNNNVTVERCQCPYIFVSNGNTGAVINDNTINRGLLWAQGIQFSAASGGSARRNNISNVENGVNVQTNTGVVIQDNYIHDLLWDSGGSPSHYDCIELATGQAGNTVINHNTFDGAITGDAFGQDKASAGITGADAITVSSNYFTNNAVHFRAETGTNGGTCSGNIFAATYTFFYVVDQSSGTLAFTNNTFGGVLFSSGHP